VPVLTTSKFNADTVAALTGPEWLRAQRLRAWDLFAASKMPSESEEIWRYSRIDDLDLERYAPCPSGETGEIGLDGLPGKLADLVSAAGPGATVLVSHNGGHGSVLHPQTGLAVEPAGEGPLGATVGAVAGPAPALGGPRADVWTSMNEAFAQVTWRATVGPGVLVASPLVVVHWLDRDGAAIFPRLEVELGANASLEVVELIASTDVDLLTVPVTQLVLGPGSRLGFGQVQFLGGRAWQLGNQVSRMSRDAALRSMTVSLGGDYARVRTDSVLEGPGGDSELLAAYFGSRHQMHDLRTVQHHAAPRSRSNLLFKGAVANVAHSVYSGLIRVEKGAKGTNAFQTNRNLVLSEGAQADSVPNLEIEDNDVRCSHASAVGPIDESQLFYLESRGVPTRVAERLIALGFIDDVLERFPVPPMLAWLRRALAAKLDSAGFGTARQRADQEDRGDEPGN
jgi:Fe-S cluster assembly protein SufD